MRTTLCRLAGLFRRSRRDAALDEEVQAHLDLLAADYERRGISPEGARLAARRAFGGIEPMKERYRDGLRLRWLEGPAGDMRFGLRGMRGHPGLTATAVITPGRWDRREHGGFSPSSMHVFLQPLAVEKPDELQGIGTAGPSSRTSRPCGVRALPARRE